MANEALIQNKDFEKSTVFGLLTTQTLRKVKKAVNFLQFEFELADFNTDNYKGYLENENQFLKLESQFSFA